MGLKNIIYNCKHATYLIEKQHDGQITWKEKFELFIHLRFCSLCRLFGKQSRLINAMVKQLLNDSAKQDGKLDDAFKQKLQGIIDAELNKN